MFGSVGGASRSRNLGRDAGAFVVSGTVSVSKGLTIDNDLHVAGTAHNE